MARRGSDSGQTLVFVALAMPVLLGFLGLGIDMGYMRYMKRQVQMAADAAAIAGADELGKSDVYNAAMTAVSTDNKNSFPTSVSQSTGCTATPVTGATVVLVNIGPIPCLPSGTTDPHVGNINYVEVVVVRSVPTFFSAIFGFNSVAISARGEAGLGSSTNCLYVLDPTMANALNLAGTATLALPSCSIFVNSSSATAVDLAQTSTSITASSVDIVGNCYEGGQGKSDTKCSTVTPTPTIGVAAAKDPLAYLTPPTYTPCASATSLLSIGSTTVQTISASNYCGGISIGNSAKVTFSGGSTPTVVAKGIQIGGASTVTFGAGLYVIEGGGLSIGNGATVTGSGVTFFLTGTSTFPYKGVALSGGPTIPITLSAPTSGTYAGILFYQDSTAYGATTAPASSFSNGTNTILNGALYFPTTAVTYSGGSLADYTILVADSVSISGSAQLNSNFPAQGSPIKSTNAVLGE